MCAHTIGTGTRDRRISIRGQIVAKKFCAAGSRPSQQGVVTILDTKPNASSFPATVLLQCNFTDEDKKHEIVVTLLGVLPSVDNRPTVARDLYGTWRVVCYVTVRKKGRPQKHVDGQVKKNVDGVLCAWCLIVGGWADVFD